MSNIGHIDEQHFFTAIQDKQALIACFLSPSKECQAYQEVLNIAATNHPEVRFVLIDISQERSLATEFQVHSVPALMVFREAVILFSQHGALSPAQLEDLIAQAQTVDMDAVRQEKQKQYE